MAELLAPTFSSTFANEFKIIAAAYEGYLFPNTYVFSSADTPESIVGTLRDTFSKAIESLHPALATSTHSLPDIVRIAAILEREAKTKEDMRIIAGILWRRIALAMPLQVDAAPETYRIQGLPRVPIANPGLVAIEAALNPYASKYLFYLTGKDGLMHYAKTFAEHQANLERYLK
jgi:UPF0755 protein